MLTEELENMVRVEGRNQFGAKGKAVIALFPYSVWLERGGDNRMIDAYPAVIRAQKGSQFVDMASQPFTALLYEAGPDFPNRAMVHMLPHVHWERLPNTDLIPRWAAAALAVPYTEEVGQSVVNALLRIAYWPHLQPYIPVNIWAWLKKLSSLPPNCEGRKWGSYSRVVCRVQELRDAEILESYFLLVWSEWDSIRPDGFEEMCASIREDLGGIGVRHRREVLVKRLDHVLGQLDMGLEHLRQQNPDLNEDHIRTAISQYQELKEVLLEVDREATEILTRTPLICSFNLLTPADVHRISLNVHLCTPSPCSLVAHPQYLLLILPTLYFIHASVPLRHSFGSIGDRPTLSIMSPNTSIGERSTCRHFRIYRPA